ncbi:MAG: hypothetical protein ACYC09_12995 [Bacteroidota bacterium]
MSTKLSNKIRVGITSEATQNTKPAIAATDYVWIPRSFPKSLSEKLRQDYAKSSLDPLPVVAGKKSQSDTLIFPLRGSLTSNTAFAPLHALLKALGFTITGGTAATDWTVAPISDNPSNMLGPATSVSIEKIMDGLLHDIKGAVGNGVFKFAAGEMGILEAAMQGIDVAITDQASWPTSPSETPNTVAPPILESSSLKIDNATGHTAHTIEIDCGNTVSMIDDAAGASGVGGFIITAKQPKITIGVLARTVAAYDYWNKMRNATQINSSSVGLQFVLGSVAMNKFTFTVPSLQIETADYEDVNGMLAVKLVCVPAQTSGNDWMNIVIDNA